MNVIDSGIIIINKPEGMTSAGVVSSIRRFLGMRRVGHTGTLDPFATGVLPICFGRATAAAHYMLKWTKRYRCLAALGAATDTMDRDGRITERAPETVLPFSDETALRDAVASLSTISEQQAPLYSAVKRDGKPLYAYARQGIDVERPLRKIAVYESKLLSLTEEGNGFSHVQFECHVSSGTYIRVLVDSLGRTIGTLAYADALERIATGSFSLENSVTLEELSQRFNATGGDRELWQQELKRDGLILSTGTAFTGWPNIRLTREEALAITHGQHPNLPHCVNEPFSREAAVSAPPPDDSWVALFYEEELIAVAERDDARYRLRRVFCAPSFFA
ncbi:MAG: tRNA pseudouridine(55) synthase TruB [Clostridiaceae bacterium]|jgi:tRNA pseudouridine55 synthase|nr:tRNA pseudouridine(55) synthase TruB [Clostridiaceae bacterium]